MSMMTEDEVSESARKFLVDKYHQAGNVVWHFEATDVDGDRPDLIVIIGYQSPSRQWVVHSVESKAEARSLRVLDRRETLPAVAQARKYYANYRWLAISKEAYGALEGYEWRKLVSDCRKTKHPTGFLVAYKTETDLIVKPGYYPGSWIEYYANEEWYVEQLSD